MLLLVLASPLGQAIVLGVPGGFGAFEGLQCMPAWHMFWHKLTFFCYSTLDSCLLPVQSPAVPCWH